MLTMVLQISLFYSQNLQVQPKVTVHWRLHIKLNQVKSNRMKCFEPGEKTLRAEYTSSKFNPHKASSLESNLGRICGRRLLSLLRQSNSLSSDYSLPSGPTNTHFLKVVIYNGFVFTDYPCSAWTGVMRRLKCRGRVLANKEFDRCQRSICSDFLETNDNL